MNPGDVAYTKDWDTYFVGEISLLVHNGCRSKNKLKPDLNAQGDHTVFRRGPDGSINKYATYKQNPKNPTGFDEVLRFDGVGKSHNGVPTPHIHEGDIVRAANPSEIPIMKG